jgi:molybdopterin-guanine dinucleotide biosynthesis protein A
MGITGIILAGGQSSRMGSEKSLLQVSKISLIESSINLLEQHCSDIIISTNNPQLYNNFRYRKISDRITGRGPLEGIAAALEWSSTEINFVLAVDMPGVTADFIKFIISRTKGYRAVIPVSENNIIQPLCGVYTTSMLSEIDTLLLNGKSAAAAITDLPGVLKIKVDKYTPGYSGKMFANLNTPSDLRDWNDDHLSSTSS